MKNIKKILAAIALVAVLCVGVALVATAEGEEPHVCTAQELADAQTLLEAVELVQDEESGFWNTATAKNALNAVKAMVDGHDFSDFDGADAFYSDYAAATKAVDDAISANKTLLEAEAELDEYDNYNSFVTGNFNNGEVKFTSLSGNNIDRMKVNESEDGNKYLYTKHTEDLQIYGQYGLTSYDLTCGFVLEFDFTTFSQIPSKGCLIENGSLTTTGPKQDKGYPIYMRIDPKGDIRSGDNTLIYENAIVPGEWTRFAIVYKPDSFTFHIFVNYEEVGSYTACTNVQSDSSNWIYYYTPSAIRISGSGSNGDWAIDNISHYAGTHIINPNKFDDMENDEKFAYYTQYLSDETKGASGRRIAYNNATELIGYYWNGSEYLTSDANLKAGVDKYLAYDPDAISLMIANNNRDEFIAMVEELYAEPRALDNVATRQVLNDDIASFLSKCGAEITVDSAYNAANEKLRVLKNEIYTDININQFVRAMNRFDLVDSLKARQKYYNKAYNLAVDESYPIGHAFYEECKADYEADPENNVGFVTFIEAYEKFLDAGAIVSQHQLRNNSEAIISCVSFIDDYLDTPDEWFTEENYDYINRYILIIRDLVNVKGYDAEYEGIDEALDVFEIMDEAFYDYLQLQHVAEISKYLDLIAQTDSFIEKMGMCSYITRYFNEQDIDFTRDDISALKINHDTYLAELAHREADYADVLVQNSYYFNNYVRKMLLAETYEEKKALYDQAALYYFSLDATVNGTAEMIDEFDSYGEVLTEMEEGSVQFVIDAAILKTELEAEAPDADKIYEALVNCYGNYEYAEEYFDGVAEAKALYEATSIAYVQFAETVNSELANTSDVIVSVRANSGVYNVIVIAMEKIFG